MLTKDHRSFVRPPLLECQDGVKRGYFATASVAERFLAWVGGTGQWSLQVPVTGLNG